MGHIMQKVPHINLWRLIDFDHYIMVRPLRPQYTKQQRTFLVLNYEATNNLQQFSQKFSGAWQPCKIHFLQTTESTKLKEYYGI